MTVTVAAPPAGSAPVAAYSFDDGAGTIAGDASGNGRQGTIAGASWTTGKFGSALSFDGAGDRVDLPDLGRFYKLGFTFEAWVNKSTAKSDVGIVGTWNAGQNGGPMLWVDHILNHYYLTLNSGSFNYVDFGQGPLVGQWQHIAATYDGATARVYVNGTQVASQAFTANVGDSGNWRIGAYGPTPTGFFEGLIDEVRIYDRPLTAAQVQSDMNAPVAAGPAVVATTPANGATHAGAAPAIEARFNEAMSAASISSSTFQLRNGSGTLVPATVAYDAATGKASLAVSAALSYGATYTATVKGGASGVKDAGGDPMASDRSWSFTVTPQPPILLVTSAARPFSAYGGEILKAEGLAAYTSLDISLLTPAALSGFDEVVLGDAVLTAAQVTTLSDWVTAGGNLIALRPDKKLASLLGLVDLGATLSNGYLKVATTAGTPGAGIVSQTIQYHGAADRYFPNGATTVATLYSDATTPTLSPAVTMRSVGINGGQAAAFTYDLGRSTVYTRQGNPAWAGQERDGVATIRPDDLFFGAKPGDLQPDWVDLGKVTIPQADEQQRLLANLITLMGEDRKPVPRLWYLPQRLQGRRRDDRRRPRPRRHCGPLRQVHRGQPGRLLERRLGVRAVDVLHLREHAAHQRPGPELHRAGLRGRAPHRADRRASTAPTGPRQACPASSIRSWPRSGASTRASRHLPPSACTASPGPTGRPRRRSSARTASGSTRTTTTTRAAGWRRSPAS